MKNPITWAVSRLKDILWRREFQRLPIKKLGNLYVKEMRGSFYAVDVEDVTPMRLHVGHNKVLKTYEIYKDNGEVLLYVNSKKEAKELVRAANLNAR